MKIDGYTKVVFTGIAIFLGFIAFDYKPSMKAEAGIMGGSEIVLQGIYTTHFKDGRIRYCTLISKPGHYTIDQKPRCSPWSD